MPGSGVKENNGPGLFSMFGGGSSQCQAPTDAAVDKSTNKESTGRDCFPCLVGQVQWQALNQEVSLKLFCFSSDKQIYRIQPHVFCG